MYDHDNTNLQKKILVVEDDHVHQELMILCLHKINYLLDIAENGTIALELHQKNNYHAILLDINLPDIKGTEISTIIRRDKLYIKKHIPIIAVTGSGEELKDECIKSGMDGFVTKPFKISTLEEQLKKYIALYFN